MKKILILTSVVAILLLHTASSLAVPSTFDAPFGADQTHCRLTLGIHGNGVTLRCSHLPEDTYEVHAHSGLPGEVGPRLFTAVAHDATTGANWQARAGDLTELKAGALYLVVTGSFGELRAQVTPTGSSPWRPQVAAPIDPAQPDAACAEKGRLCMDGGRIRVEAHLPGASGFTPGKAVHSGFNQGGFWFSDPDRPELSVRLTGGCEGGNDRELLIEPLVPIDYEVTAVDVATGELRRYRPDGASQAPIIDRQAFPCG